MEARLTSGKWRLLLLLNTKLGLGSKASRLRHQPIANKTGGLRLDLRLQALTSRSDLWAGLGKSSHLRLQWRRTKGALLLREVLRRRQWALRRRRKKRILVHILWRLRALPRLRLKPSLLRAEPLRLLLGYLGKETGCCTRMLRLLRRNGYGGLLGLKSRYGCCRLGSRSGLRRGRL